MDQNKINEREDRWVREWKDLSDIEKLPKMETLTTKYFITELISSMKDDELKLYALKASIERIPDLNDEMYITKVICSLQSDLIKEKYLIVTTDEHNKAAIMGSMKDQEIIAKYFSEITDGRERQYILSRTNKEAKN